MTEIWVKVDYREKEFPLFTETIEKYGSPFRISTLAETPCPMCGRLNCAPEEPHHDRAQEDDPEVLGCAIGGDDHSEHRCFPANFRSGVI